MRAAIAWCLLSTVCLFGQATPDQQIEGGLNNLLEILSPPEEGAAPATKAESEAKADAFGNQLSAFLLKWEPQAQSLGEGRFVLGRAYSLAGRPLDAVPHFSVFLKGFPKHANAADARVSLGAALLDAGRAARAVVILDAGLQGDGEPKRATALRYYLGLAKLEIGQADAAISLLDRVAQSAEESPLVADAALKKLEALRDLGRLSEARQWHAKLIEGAKEAPWLLALGEELARLETEAPAFVDVQDWLHSKPLKLSDLKGQVVVLNFFADRYPACQLALDRMAEVKALFAGKPVRFIGVTRWYRPVKRMTLSDQRTALLSYLKARGVTFPVLVAKGFDNLRNYGVRGIPHTVVIDKAGIIRWIDVGASPSKRRTKTRLKEAILRVL